VTETEVEEDAPLDPYNRYGSSKKNKSKSRSTDQNDEHRLQIADVPDIDVVGAPEVIDDFDFLRSILM